MTDLPPTTNEHTFWSGTTWLSAGTFSKHVNARVFLDASQSKHLRIEVINQFGFAALNLVHEDEISMKFPHVEETIDLILERSTTNSEGQDVLVFGVKKSPMWVVKSQQLKAFRTTLINFAAYRIAGVGDRPYELRGFGWVAQVAPISDQALIAMAGAHSEDYRITHQVGFAREDSAPFSPTEAKAFLEDFHYFLSFCRGRWVGTSLSVGFDQSGEVGMEEWGSGKVSPWRKPSSWVDEHHGDAILELFGPFMQKLSEEGWRDAISSVVYWFQRAKTDSAGPDGGCVLLQTSLERVSWRLLVHERRLFTGNAFNKLTAANRIRMMLSALAIPTAIPTGLEQLGLYGLAKNLDGPDVLTSLRNRLVHPPKQANALSEQMPYYEAYLLAKWYLELAILSVCGFRGDYSNRTRKTRWVGQIEKVPWA